MRVPLALVVILSLAGAPARPSDPKPEALAAFEESFLDETMRVDFHHGGNAEIEQVALDRVFRQGSWAGSRTHLLDPLEVGRYVVEVSNPGSGRLLFRKRFDSYFGEYRTTSDAAKGVWRVYHESVLVPFPRAKVRLEIRLRQRDRTHKTLLDTVIDPDAPTIHCEPLGTGVKVLPIHKSGDPHAKVDIAIVAEGYTADQEAKLKADLDRFARLLFSQEPFAAAKDRFNVWGVWKPSQEAGCDEPSRGVWRNTALGASFDALGSERYLLTEENRALRDIAAHAPYDALYIMVNHPRYGGGGIYNLYCTFTTDNQWHAYVFLHEFGHSFAGLADEYYTSSVAYNEFYPPGIEPFEANITALLDPRKPKWADLVNPDTDVPTPWEKPGYDEKDIAYQKVREALNARIATAMRKGAPTPQVDSLKEEGERLSRDHAETMNAYLAQSKFQNKVGAFEGAGYASKGLYRPSLDCIMFSKGTKPFCPVCRAAIQRVIDTYGE
jgi:hypothetical protein